MTAQAPTAPRKASRRSRQRGAPLAPLRRPECLTTRRGRRRHRIVDLFAGPGGWDLAGHALALPVLGVELDSQACKTRRAAGLPTLQADVAALNPALFGRLWGLIASPPCQAFSMAGKGAGRAAITAYIEAIGRMVRGEPVDVAALDEACGDPRGHLVLEPLRWALATRPAWIALEQVPPVLPVWEAMADALRTLGYSVWTGCVTAEQYGVPQTRRRAILTARRGGSPVLEPPATHQRYVAPRRRKGHDSLFDTGRRVRKADRHLLPWVSMADALGWPPEWTLRVERGAGMMEREGRDIPRPDRSASEPAFTITAGTERCGPRWIVDTGNTRGGTRPDGRHREVGEPAPCVTTRADQLEWRPDRYDSRGQRDSRGAEPVYARQREIDEPAPTIAAASRSDTWLLRGGNQWNATTRNVDEPAGTLAFGKTAGTDHVWVHERPATTVCADDRIAGPGDRKAIDPATGVTRRQFNEMSIRIDLDEAAVLQSFPVGYPWQGNRTQTFTQVGNAIPPLLALHILRSVALSS